MGLDLFDFLTWWAKVGIVAFLIVVVVLTAIWNKE